MIVSKWNDVKIEKVIIFGRPWQYRGEGNANVVVALRDDLKVIRLSKSEKSSRMGRDWYDIQSLQQQRRLVEREVAFANNVFIPLLGIEYGGQVTAVELSIRQIQRLNKCLLRLRPEFRLHKELRIPFATAHRDFARMHRFPSKRTDYCIEIKPKQGWWPKHLKRLHGAGNPNRCTYCLNQFLKLERSKITRRTDYCPLDLFSGSSDRMIESILALLSNPQNNLRIFRDGFLAYGDTKCDSRSLEEVLSGWIGLGHRDTVMDMCGDESAASKRWKLVSNFTFLLCTALLGPQKSHSQDPSSQSHSSPSYEKIKDQLECNLRCEDYEIKLQKESNCDGNEKYCREPSQNLPSGSILSRVLDIQKMAEVEGGVERIYSLYNKICPVHCYPSLSEEEVGDGLGTNCSITRNVCCEDHNSPRVEASKKKKFSQEESSSSSDEIFEEMVYMEEVQVRSGHNRVPDLTSTVLDESLFGLLSSDPADESVSSSDSSGLASLSQDDDEDYDEEGTLREELSRCPGPHCLSQEKWLDELCQNKLPSTLSKKDVMDMEKYLIAATAKDCSIMLTFSPMTEEEEEYANNNGNNLIQDENGVTILQDLNGAFHRLRIGVADLDPKPVSCIAKHHLRDKDMLEDFYAYSAAKSAINVASCSQPQIVPDCHSKKYSGVVSQCPL